LQIIKFIIHKFYIVLSAVRIIAKLLIKYMFIFGGLIIMPDQLLGWIKFAITLEEKELDFYTRCSAQAKDAHAQTLFKFLVNQENEHKGVLNKLLDEVTKGDQRKIREGVVAFEDMHRDIPVFNMADIQRISKPDASLQDMLNTAINMEMESAKFYQEVAQKEVNSSIKSLFEYLLKQETEHKNIIKKFGMRLLGLSLGTVR